jgi:hypothetical protein
MLFSGTSSEPGVRAQSPVMAVQDMADEFRRDRELNS